jgi:hypothetical protein
VTAEIPDGFQVRLRRDYSRYHKDLKTGSVGTAERIPVGRATFSRNHFVRVRFHVNQKETVTIDVLRSDLDVIDTRWSEWQERESKALDEALRDHVSKATVYTTRRGGFIELVVEYNNGRPNDIWRKRADCKSIITDLEKRGLLAIKER